MTPLERVQGALRGHGSRQSGPSEWTCPAHDDAKASLSVTATTDGKVLLKCHADCESSTVVTALGLGWADLFPEPKVGQQRHSTIVATYPYVDERSRPLFEVVRFAPKDFRQRRSDGNSGWIWNLNGTRRVLYRLPRILDAVTTGKTIYLVEGEKDVHALEQAGAVATCNPMGAGKWQGSYAEALAGASVVVVADRDQAGRNHARTVAASLRAHGCTVQVVEAAEGKDATDHLQAGHALDDLVPVNLDAETPIQPPTLPDRPATIPELLQAMSGYLHLDDPDHVLFSLAVAVSAELDGSPLWGMLLGAPSGGKTEAIELLRGRGVHLDELTNAGLLGWQHGKGKTTPAVPGGALVRLGPRGLLTISDMSTLLAREQRSGSTVDQVFANLRRVHDGHLSRDLAPPPGAVGELRWQGRATLLAACTPAIDRFAGHAEQLGPRWVYFRLRRPGRDAQRQRQRKVLAAAQLQQAREQAGQLASAIVEQTIPQARAQTISEPMAERIFDAAQVACWGRGAVPRHGYGKREIDGFPVVEDTPRLTGQLLLLARCLLALGQSDAETLRLVRRAALGSIPENRSRALAALTGGVVLTGRELAKALRCSAPVAIRTAEDLAALELVEWPEEPDDEHDGFPPPKYWQLTSDDERRELVESVLDREAFCQLSPVNEVDNPQPPSPPIKSANKTNPPSRPAALSTSFTGTTSDDGQPPDPTPDGRLLDLDRDSAPPGQRAHVCDRCGAKRTAIFDMTGLPHPDCPAGGNAHFRLAGEAA